MVVQFSIILPVFNAKKTLPHIMDGLLSQSFRDFELLAVDDGSTDGSGQILEQFAAQDNRIRVLHKENGGANSARNLALQYVQGEYVVFCDADDWVEEDWLQNFADNLLDNDVVVQGWTYVTETERLPQYYEEVPKTPAEAADLMSQHESFGFLWNKCFRTGIIANNELRFDERFRFLEDEEFICRYWTHVQKVAFSPTVSYHYLMPDFNKKYNGVDNFQLYISLLDNASKFISYPFSVTMQKYTMGLFRNMMLAFQRHQCREAWHRLKILVDYGKKFKCYNRYMQIITPRNYLLWYPILFVYCSIRRI